MIVVEVHDEAATAHFAARIARLAQPGDIIALQGDLGAGKTTFVRGFVPAFGIDARNVQSPTFTLVREYGSKKKIYHVDLYRLEKEKDIFEAGIHELLGTDELVLVEWADRLKNYLPSERIELRFEHMPGDEREIVINVVRAPRPHGLD